ncbi:MAG: HU family DNA-binding protein [Bacteroidaceae bacterium]|nr:HU family DNA-binding protein [Bacteroidaceae bacterium]
MAEVLGADADDVQKQVGTFVNLLVSQIKDGNTLTIKNLGVFEPKTKSARKMYNPTTKTFNVIPAKKTIGFKMSATLKDKLNNLTI